MSNFKGSRYWNTPGRNLLPTSPAPNSNEHSFTNTIHAITLKMKGYWQVHVLSIIVVNEKADLTKTPDGNAPFYVTSWKLFNRVVSVCSWVQIPLLNYPQEILGAVVNALATN